MASAIHSEGLSVERYNALTALMAQGKAFAARVNASLQRAQAPAAAPAQPGQATAPAGPSRTLDAELPTTGDGAALVAALTEVCLPMVRQDRPVSEVAPAKGFKKDRRAESFTRELEGKSLGITVFPRGSNEAVCRMEVRHAIGGEKPIVDAATVWAALAKPRLEMRRNDVATGATGCGAGPCRGMGRGKALLQGGARGEINGGRKRDTLRVVKQDSISHAASRRRARALVVCHSEGDPGLISSGDCPLIGPICKARLPFGSWATEASERLKQWPRLLWALCGP